MVIFLNVMNPTNLTNLSDLTSELRETSNVLNMEGLIEHFDIRFSTLSVCFYNRE